MHTLPLPEVTDNTPNPKVETANSKSGGAPIVPSPASCDFRVSSANPPHVTPQQLQFLLRVTPPALESECEYKVPACITIAQAILESATAAGWGSSSLFRLANNPFGIKYCHFGAGGWGLGIGGSHGTQHPAVATSKLGTGDTALKTCHSGPSTGGAANATLAQKSESRIPNSGYQNQDSEPAVPSPLALAPIPEDYGHFDAQTWEIENGRKKVIVAQFQRFPNLSEAFRCHALLLAKSPRYAPAMQTVRDQKQATGESASQTLNPQPQIPPWQQFAERLGPKISPLDNGHCGYSTSPGYAAELIKLVNLYRLNDPRALQWFATGMDPGHRPIALPNNLAIEPQSQIDQPLTQSTQGTTKSAAAGS